MGFKKGLRCSGMLVVVVGGEVGISSGVVVDACVGVGGVGGVVVVLVLGSVSLFLSMLVVLLSPLFAGSIACRFVYSDFLPPSAPCFDTCIRPQGRWGR